MIKKIVMLSLSVILIFLIGCNNKTEESPLKDLSISVEGKDVTSSFTLPLNLEYKGNSYEITWESNNDEVLIISKSDNLYNVTVKRKESDVNVSLKALVKIDNKEYEKIFNFKVLKLSNKNNDIVILHSFSDNFIEILNTAVNTLKELYPSYNIELINYRSSYYIEDTIEEVKAKGKDVNLIFGDISSLINFVDEPNLYDFSSFVNGNSEFFNSFNQSALTSGTYNDKQVMLPYALNVDFYRMNSHFINYLIDKGLFTENEANNISNWTWEEYLNFSKMITDEFGEKPYLLANDSFANVVMLRLLQKKAINSNGEVNKDLIIDTLNMMIDEYEQNTIEYAQAYGNYISYLGLYDENDPESISILFAGSTLNSVAIDSFDYVTYLPSFKENDSEIRLLASTQNMMMFDVNEETNGIVLSLILSFLAPELQVMFVNGLSPVSLDAYNSSLYDGIVLERYKDAQNFIKDNFNSIGCVPLSKEVVSFYSDLNSNFNNILVNHKVDNFVNKYFN